MKNVGKKSRFNTFILFLIGVLVVFSIIGVCIYCNYLKFLEIGYQYTNVFVTNMIAKLEAQLISFVIVFLFILINNLVIRKVVYKENKDLNIIKNVGLCVIITFIMSFFVSSIISDNVYTNFLTFKNVTWFGETDPVFGWDLGYYIFTRPFFIAVVDSVKGLLMFNIIYTIFLYVLLQLRGGISELKGILQNKGVFIHCFVNLMLFIIGTALVYKFNIEDLLFNKFSSVTGAGATDLRVWYTYYKIAPFLLIIIVPISIHFLCRGQFRRAVISVCVFPALWIAAVMCAVVNQAVFVNSNELSMESKYLSYNIQMTRKAYGLDTIEEETYNIDNNLTYKDIIANVDILDNINITSKNETLDAIKKLQGLGNYYAFKDSDVVPYEIDGKKKLVSISPREIDTDKISKANDTYVNKTFKYTHGTGIVMTNLNQVDSLGQLIFMVKDIPVLSNIGISKVDEPRIYYGENTNNIVVVGTGHNEIDYENTDQNIGYKYNGFGGAQMTLFNRIVLAFSERNYKLLFSGQITENSRALVNRNIIKRVNTIAPFFRYDSDPYMILTDDGKLKWIIDGYAVTNQYPYSTSITNINYIRNCVKVVVDAYNGNVIFYATDKENPFVQTYQKMYPTLFSKDDIPSNIQSHLRYPQDIFKIKSEMYKRYHVTDIDNFYGNSDMWDISKIKATKNQYISPYYTLLNDNNNIECNLMTPYTQYKDNNINSYLVANCDKSNYEKMRIYKLNQGADNKAYGIIPIQNAIADNDVVLDDIKTLSQNGGTALYGNIQVLPIKQSLLYIQPIYATNVTGSSAVPLLKRVIVSYNGNISIGQNLQDAVRKLFNVKDNTFISKQINTTLQNEPTLNDLINNAISMYNRAKEYNKVGDWENYGKAMKEFEDIMNLLEQKKNEIDIDNNFVGPKL